MQPYFADVNQALLLQARVLKDALPDRPLELAYTFANTEDNQGSVFPAARRLARSGRVQKIGYCAAPDDGHGYPGGDKWREGLLATGLEKSALVPIEPVGTPETVGRGGRVNTMTEAVGLVGYARKNGLDELGIIAAPFHQLRAVITTVSVLKREHPRLRVYNYAGDPLALDGVAVHSQGTTTGVRADLFFGELERIVAYHEKGDLVSLEEALKYLEERDRASSVSAAA